MPVVGFEGNGGEFSVGGLDAVGYQFGSWPAWMMSPVWVVLVMSSMMVRRLVRDRPGQLVVMKLNMRCSILYHLGLRFDV